MAACLLVLVGLAGAALPCQAQSHADFAEGILRENKAGIVEAAHDLGQSPRVLASVIFAERSLNLRLGKSLAEDVLARCGYNSSLGVAQIKMQTAFWIEGHMRDLSGAVSLGAQASQSLSPSRTRGELIERLEEPSINLLYAAAYVALISRMWADVLGAPETRDVRVGIIATLYSLGLQFPDGSLRVPHHDPQMNHFGEVAQSFYDGPILKEEFPKEEEGK